MNPPVTPQPVPRTLIVSVRGVALNIREIGERFSVAVTKTRTRKQVSTTHTIAIAVDARRTACVFLRPGAADLSVGTASFEVSINQALKIASTFGLRTIDERREFS